MNIAGFGIATLLAISLFGQDTAFGDLDRLRQELQEAIQAANFTKASEVAVKLDDAVQGRYRASLNQDAGERMNQVLHWLPADTETLFVLQYPTVLHAQDSPEIAGDGPARQYAFERLRALNNGDVYRRLQGKTVRLAVAAARDMPGSGTRLGMIPAMMPDIDVTYTYFFTEPLGQDVMGEPDVASNVGPVWRGTAKVDAGEPWTPGRRVRAQREDSSWLALPRPDLLIVCSRRETLEKLVQNIGRGIEEKPDRALPESLSIWQQVDRKAKFWALRSYPGPAAGGVTVRFDVETGELDIRYLGGAAKSPNLDPTESQQFKTTQMQNGVWQFEASIRERGDFPFHVAAAMLGFGVYY